MTATEIECRWAWANAEILWLYEHYIFEPLADHLLTFLRTYEER